MVFRIQRHGWRGWLGMVGACCLLPNFVGCANTFDTITGQRFRESPFHSTFTTEEPIIVLRNVQEGDQRSKAMLALKEPKRNGGSDDLQNEVMQILGTSATSDKQAYCRLSAIETLARFEDPRAQQYLVTAYQSAALETPLDKPATPDAGVIQAGRRTRTPFAPVSIFTPDMVIRIQCLALESLGKKRSPEGLTLMIEMATTPVKKEVKLNDLESLTQTNLGQDQFDIRLAALHAMGNYRGDARAAQVLYQVMTTEHDVALKNRAYESLKNVSGKDFPANSKEWATVVKIDPNLSKQSVPDKLSQK